MLQYSACFIALFLLPFPINSCPNNLVSLRISPHKTGIIRKNNSIYVGILSQRLAGNFRLTLFLSSFAFIYLSEPEMRTPQVANQR